MSDLAHEDKVAAFRKATGGLSGAARRWSERAGRGLTDAELIEALKFEIGTFGGCGGPNRMSMAWQAAGLKIWASWTTVDLASPPVLEGEATLAMARAVYGTPNPDEPQMALL